MTNNNMYFVANWKMHGNTADINKSKSVIKLANIKKYKILKIIYCPPFTLLKTFFDKIRNSNVFIGAQNCHSISEHGAYTGSINAKLIKSTGAKYIILGHSENRKSGETDKIINKKIHSALKENLKVIFCIGEKLSEKRKKNTYNILKKQLINGLKDIKKIENIIIAYEPVWSIGTGLVPKSEDLNHVISFIKIFLRNKMKFKNPKVLYGGSVSPQNISLLRKVLNLDGFLVGGSSQNSKKFIDIIKKTFI